MENNLSIQFYILILNSAKFCDGLYSYIFCVSFVMVELLDNEYDIWHYKAIFLEHLGTTRIKRQQAKKRWIQEIRSSKVMNRCNIS